MRRTRSGYRRRGNFRALAFIALAFTLVFVLAGPLQKFFSQRAQINSLKNQVNANENALAQARRELSQWNDPEFIKSQARSRLHFVMPGERKYVITGSQSLDQTPETLKVSESATHGVPWYTRLISSITETSK